MKSLKKNILLIGSDSGIAQKFLKFAIQNGDRLKTVSRRKDSEVKSNMHYQLDLSDMQKVDTFAKDLRKSNFDVFIYCPGIFIPEDTTCLTTTEIINQMNVNLLSAIALSIPILKSMELKKKGLMLFIGSSSSYAGFKKTSIYCSSKHGLLGYARSISEEFRNSGIKISCISPGSINTKMSIPLHKTMDPNTFINPDEISELLIDLVYSPKQSMWQEEIILKRLKY